jgi:hypothetical protein
MHCRSFIVSICNLGLTMLLSASVVSCEEIPPFYKNKSILKESNLEISRWQDVTKRNRCSGDLWTLWGAVNWWAGKPLYISTGGAPGPLTGAFGDPYFPWQKSWSSALEHSLPFYIFSFFYILFHPSLANAVPLSRIQLAFDAHYKPWSSRKRMTPQHRKGEPFLLGPSASSWAMVFAHRS